jgi:hypothetical protein
MELACSHVGVEPSASATRKEAGLYYFNNWEIESRSGVLDIMTEEPVKREIIGFEVLVFRAVILGIKRGSSECVMFIEKNLKLGSRQLPASLRQIA